MASALRRASHAIATIPVISMSQVPGSGTTPLAPHGPLFFFFLSLASSGPAPSPLPGFLPGEQTPLGSGGGERGTTPPTGNGVYKLRSGARGWGPPNTGRFKSADSNSTGGIAVELSWLGSTGTSNFATAGTIDSCNCCGTSSTRLPQRARTVILPSVISFSPLCRVILCLVQ